MGGVGGSYWAICWLFESTYKCCLFGTPFLVYSLYPLTKSVGTELRFCLVRGHMMPTKTSICPNEVVRLEVLRLCFYCGFAVFCF
jgi:hypothetical protein